MDKYMANTLLIINIIKIHITRKAEMMWTIIYDLITTKTTIIPALHIFFLSASHILPEILSDTPDE